MVQPLIPNLIWLTLQESLSADSEGLETLVLHTYKWDVNYPIR